MMKRLLLLLLLCLFLSGCAAHGGHRETESPVSAREESSSLPECLYDPDSPLEAETAGVLKVYPLPHMEPQGLWAAEDGLILMGQAEGCTLLQSLTGKKLTVTGSRMLNTFLSPEDGYLQVFSHRLACYDPMVLQVIVLDMTLQELERIHVPPEVTGTPLLSPSGETLYYCTRDAVRALELKTGISRVLKEISGQHQTTTALHNGEKYLQCTLWEEDGSEKTLLLSTDTGRLVWQQDGTAQLTVREGNYWCRFSSSGRETLVFGREDSQPMTLIPADMGGSCHFLPRSNGVLSQKEQELDYYDLAAGKRTAVLNLPQPLSLVSVADGGNGIVWLLGEDCIYRWDVSRSLTTDSGEYTGGYSTGSIPDSSSRETCLEFAHSLSERFSIEILLFEEAVSTHSPDCRLETGMQPALVMRQLADLERQLEILPSSLLENLSAQYGGLKIRLVGRILPEEGAVLPDDPEGFQFWEEDAACIVLASHQTQTTFLHQLFHLMDTAAFTRTGSFDLWETLNPMQFFYTYSYSDPPPEGYEKYLQPDTRAFADLHSISFPREERARIFELAAQAENHSLFQSHTMQKKLTAICTGIRETFGLQGFPDNFLWEQYLKTPLA